MGDASGSADRVFRSANSKKLSVVPIELYAELYSTTSVVPCTMSFPMLALSFHVPWVWSVLPLLVALSDGSASLRVLATVELGGQRTWLDKAKCSSKPKPGGHSSFSALSQGPAALNMDPVGLGSRNVSDWHPFWSCPSVPQL